MKVSTYNVFLILIIGVSIFLRVWKFSDIPEGLNQDEVSAAYEAWSLLETGKDRWGNDFPVYFPSWGRGQNVLYSYICIPFYYLFGVNDFTFRLPNLLLNISSIFLVFFLFRKEQPLKTILAVAVIGLSPWHLVISRWALEENMLPFWFFLHFLLFIKTIKNYPRWIWISFIPLSFAVYSYVLIIISLPLYFILILSCFRKGYYYQWLIGGGIFTILCSTLLLFLFKPYFDFIPIEIGWMTLPDMPQWPINLNETWKSLIHTNLMYIFKGFHDSTIYNTTFDTFPHPSFYIVFASIGIVISVFKFKDNNPNFKIWLAAIIASLVPFFFFKMNLNRAFLLQIALLVLVIEGCWFLMESLKENKLNSKVFKAYIITAFTINSLWMGIDYFRFYPSKTYADFSGDLDGAIGFLSDREEQVFFTDQIYFPYLYAAFYGKIKPSEFQRLTKGKRIVEGRYIVDAFENYIFHYKNIKPLMSSSIVEEALVILRKEDSVPLKRSKILFQNRNWKVIKVLEE